MSLDQWEGAGAQLSRIDPYLLPKVGERAPKLAHERVVLRTVGDEELAHAGITYDAKREVKIDGGPFRSEI